VPVTNETRFGVASITKAFTGLALLKLHEVGRIDLDVPIQRYVPAFPVKPGGVITPRLLAAHLAGIRHWGPERNAALYARHFDDVNDTSCRCSRMTRFSRLPGRRRAIPATGTICSRPQCNLRRERSFRTT
jgi:CubicO group peptidase (beta-lactamase class C family)